MGGGRGERREKEKRKGRGKGEGRGKRENVNRKRQKGKRFIKSSFCESQIFLHVFFSPFPSHPALQQGTQQHQPRLCQEEQQEEQPGENIPSSSPGRALSSRRVCAQGKEPVLWLGSAPAPPRQIPLDSLGWRGVEMEWPGFPGSLSLAPSGAGGVPGSVPCPGTQPRTKAAPQASQE